MPETTTTEVTETVTEDAQQDQADQADQLPADHPLVKTLAALKSQNKELKGKARRLDELEESQKSEAEKTADRIKAAEALAQTVPSQVAESLKAHLVTLHQIDSEDAELFLTADEPELLLKQVTRLLEQSGKRRKNHVPREGENPSAATTSDMREFTRGLFGKGD